MTCFRIRTYAFSSSWKEPWTFLCQFWSPLAAYYHESSRAFNPIYVGLFEWLQFVLVFYVWLIMRSWYGHIRYRVSKGPWSVIWQTFLRMCLLSLIPGLVKCKRRSYLLNFELFFCFLLLRKKIIITPGIKHISFDKAINRIGQRKGLKGIGITSKYKQYTYWFITGLWLINRGAFGTKTYFTF